MLNIVSRSARTTQMGGQIKVFRNLVAGLERIGYPFVVNRRLDSCELLWVHDDQRALPKLHKLPLEIRAIVGPNLYVMPRDVPKGVNLSRAIYLHPAVWVTDQWKLHGFDRCPLRAWPVGIDTDLFTPQPVTNRSSILLYHKQRDPEEFAQLRQMVSDLGLEHDVTIYGSYEQADYLQKLSRAKYVIWHGRHESQGIALQEAMAAGVPILVWDITKLKQFWHSAGRCYQFTKEELEFPATAAPYFDSRCGIRVTETSQIPLAIRQMEELWLSLRPREYVEEHLSLAGQARALLKMFETEWGPTMAASYPDRIGRPWRPPLTWVLAAAKRRLLRRYP